MAQDFYALVAQKLREQGTEGTQAAAAHFESLGKEEQTPATASASAYAGGDARQRAVDALAGAIRTAREKLTTPQQTRTQPAQTAAPSLALPTPEEWANRAQSELAGALRTVPGGSVTVQPTQRTASKVTAPDYSALVEKLRAAAQKSEADEGVSHKSGKFDDPSSIDYGAERRAAEREAAAFQPTSDMYLNPRTAEAARAMQDISDAAAARAAEKAAAEEENKSPLEKQREKTAAAYGEAWAMQPTSDMYLHPATAAAAEEMQARKDAATERAEEENRKLHEMGGRYGLKEDAQTIGENLVAGLAGAGRGLANAAAYAGQEITRGQLMEQQSVMSGLPGQKEIADSSGKLLEDMQQRGLQSFAQQADTLGLEGLAKADKSIQDFTRRAAEHSSASGKVTKAMAATANGVGGMIPSILVNLAAPGTSLWVMMAQAAGNATEEALEAGAQDEKAVLYGLAVGGVEALTEKITGGIPGLGVGALDDMAEGLVKRALKSEAAQKAAMLLVKALGEGVEEFTSEFADYGLNRWLVKNDERSLGEVHKDAWYSALIGALTSFVMSTPGEVLERMSPKEMARTVADDAMERVEVNQRAEDLKLPAVENEKTAPEGTAESAHDAQMREKATEDARKEDKAAGGNRRMTEADVEKWTATGATGHQKHQKLRNIAEGLNVVLTSEEQIRNFIMDAAEGKTDPQTRVYGVIGENMARDIFETSNGAEEVEGHYLELPPNDIRHSYEDHLHAKQQGDIDLTMDDFVRIPDYIDTYDNITYEVFPNGDAEVVIGKKIDGYAVIIELVAGKRQSLMFKQMRGMSDAKYNGIYKKRNPAYSGGVQAQSANATTSKPGVDLSMPKIPQPGEEVKTGLELPAVPAEKQAEARPLPTPEEVAERGMWPAEMPAEAPAAPAADEEAPAGDGMSDGGYRQTGYAASPGLRKLGVKIAEPITSTIGGDVLLAQAKKAQAAERDLNKAIRKLKPTIAEKALAKGLADGTYTEGGGVYYGPDGAALKNVNMGKVRELAEYYRQKAQYKADRIANQRRNIRMNETEKADELLRNADAFKQMGALRLNLNTPKRNMLAWAGQTLGEKINRHLFDPVERNSAERIRFAERMRDRVRDFHLTKAESEMVQRVIEGNAVQDQVSKLTEDSRRRVNAAAESKDFELTAAEYNLNAEEKEMARRYHEWLQTKVDLETMDAEKINAAAKAYTDAYSDFYTAINEFLVMHGYEPIGFIEGYAPHLQSDQVQTTLGKLLQAFGMDAEVSALPTEIAGRTENFKPGHQWNPYFQHRAGADSLIDAVAGYDSYVEYMSNVLYHTDDIQKLRIFANELRAMYASKEVREKIDQAKWLLGQSAQNKLDFLRINGMIGEGTQLTPEDATQRVEEYIDELFKKIEDKTIHGNVVSWLDDYTNKLAGKQTKLDRAVESFFGRRAINAGNALSRTFGESAVVGNLSSALNQLAQLPAVQSEVGNKYVLQAIYDILRRNTGDMDTESDFLTGKRGTESLLNERKWSELDARQKHDRVTEKMSIPFETVDMLASRLYVRAKYLQEISNGKSHQEAMRSADDFVERVVGNRIQGSRPMAFESKNAAAKLLTTFQLEVANAWAHISQDLPAEIKEIAQTQGKPAAVKRTAEILLRYSVSAFLLNRLAETVYGGTPAPFDILGYVLGGLAAGNGETVNQYLVKLVGNLLGFGGDDDEEKDFDTGAALKEAGNLVVGDLPYVRNAASLLGYGDTTLPLPQVGNTVKAAGKLVSGKGSAGDLGKAALKDAATWLPGGNQLKKTAQGIETVKKKGRYDSQGNLMYPVDFSGAEGAAKAAKAIAFGRSSLGATDAYFASGDRALSKAQTEAYEYLVGIGEDPQTVYDTMQAVRGVKNVTGTDEDGKEKRDILRRADLDDYSKAQLYSVLLSSGEDEQQKTYEKLAGMMDLGLDFDDCMDVVDKYKEVDAADEKAGMKASRFAQWADENFDEDQAAEIKDAYKYWQNIPAEASGYDLAVKAGTDLETAEAAREIKSGAEGEKDADGNTIDGTVKAEVMRSIDALETDQTTKLALMEAEGYNMKDYAGVSSFMNLTEYADILESSAMATGKKVGGKTVKNSKRLEVMLEVNGRDYTPAQKTKIMQALGYTTEGEDIAPPIWDADYNGDYESYYYMTPSERENYLTYCSWMDAEDFAKYMERIAKNTGEYQNVYGPNGEVLVSRKDQVIEYIKGLRLLTPDQKTALYVCAGYNENLTDKGFADCPWWSSSQLRTQYYPK